MRGVRSATGLLLSAVALACDGPTSLSPSGPAASHATAVAATGRIVYTDRGQLHIYSVATRIDVNLGVAGVNPKFSPDGMLITFQQNGISVMNSDGSGRRTLSATGGTPSF